MTYQCERCDDTGSLSKDLYGPLDCPYCDAAIDRALLEKWAEKNTSSASLIDAWKLFQHGRWRGMEDAAALITSGNEQVRDNGWIDCANERARCAAAIRAKRGGNNG